MNRSQYSLAAVAGLAVLSFGGTARAVPDEVTYWNDVLISEFRLDYGTGCPCPLARVSAIVQAAVYEAVNSIDHQYEPYIAFVDAPSTANQDAAVAAAAFRTMDALFPNSHATLLADFNARKAFIPNGPAKTAGLRAGNLAAAQILAARANDGSQTPKAYVFGGHPGDYRPTPPAFSPECNPEWGSVTPFCMDHSSQFRSRGPLGYQNMAALLRSPGYAEQLNEVRLLGRRNGSTRTDDQTHIAFFWANDKNGTPKPPGHMFQITHVVAQNHGLNQSEKARLFALVGLALGDAGICAWDMKFDPAINLWRPITAIHQASTDGNPLTVQDTTWNPLNPFTPPFPGYASGHATFAAAHAGVMAEFFGSDTETFTITTEDPFYNALPSHPARTYHSFSEAAVENGLSRVYLGVHFRMDSTDGNAAGFALGHHIGQNFLKRRCIADFNHDGTINTHDFYDFFSAYLAGDMSADVDGSGTVDGLDLAKFSDAYLSGC